MIALTQVASTEMLTFVVVLVFMLLSSKVLFIYKKDNRNCLTVSKLLSKLFLKKIEQIHGQSYKYLKYEKFRILLKHASNHLSVLFQFPCLYL